MACRQHDTPLLDSAHTGRSPAMAGPGTLTHLDKDHGAVARLHDEINFAAAAPGRPIIAFEQAQARGLQMLQGPVFGRRARFAGTATAQFCQLLEEPH